jgi:hypothetical protein
MVSKEKGILSVVNIANGNVQILDLTQKFRHIGRVKIKGRRIAYKARTTGRPRNDVFIDDWTTGQNLAKCSQLFGLSNADLKGNKSFHLSEKTIVVCIRGKVHFASILS